MSSSRATRPLSPARSKVSHADSTRAQSSVPSLASLDEQLPSASPFNAQMASFYNVRRRQEIAELVVTGREHGFTALAVRRRGSMLSCHCRPPLLLLAGAVLLLTPPRPPQVHQLFRLFDHDRDHALSKAQFGEALEWMGMLQSDEALATSVVGQGDSSWRRFHAALPTFAQYMQLADVGRTGDVSEVEFEAVLLGRTTGQIIDSARAVRVAEDVHSHLPACRERHVVWGARASGEGRAGDGIVEADVTGQPPLSIPSHWLSPCRWIDVRNAEPDMSAWLLEEYRLPRTSGLGCLSLSSPPSFVPRAPCLRPSGPAAPAGSASRSSAPSRLIAVSRRTPTRAARPVLPRTTPSPPTRSPLRTSCATRSRLQTSRASQSPAPRPRAASASTTRRRWTSTRRR